MSNKELSNIYGGHMASRMYEVYRRLKIRFLMARVFID